MFAVRFLVALVVTISAALAIVATSRTSVAAVAASSPGPRAPARLSESGLYAGGRVGEIDPANRPFTPQYPLWSDGAVKSRWMHLPPGSVIDATDPHAWEFPVGTRFWKEFRFGGRRIETRMIWKASPEQWVFATYAWNADETDAVLAPDEGIPGVVEVAAGRRHGLPSVADCQACHGARRPRPLGVNPLQLSDDRDGGAIHAETPDRLAATLRTLVDEGRLVPSTPWRDRESPRIRTADPGTRAVLGYLFANCGGCHDGSGEIAALGPVLRAHDLLEDADAVVRSLIDRRTAWQAPGRLDASTVLVDSGTPETSAILLRMKSRRPSSQMPPLGTLLRDEQAVEAIGRWAAAITAVRP